MAKDPDRHRQPLRSAKRRAEAIGLMLNGVSDREIARRYGITEQAVYQFRRRNQAQIEPLMAEVIERTKDVAIADKMMRIMHLDRMFGELDARRQALSDRAGMTYAAYVHQQRGILRDVAEELGQLPKAGGQDVNVAVGVITTVQVDVP